MKGLLRNSPFCNAALFLELLFLADAFAFVIGSGRRLDEVDDARDNDAGEVADAHKVVEGVVHVEAFRNEKFVDGHQDGGHEDSDKDTCNQFAHTMNVVFLEPLAGILKIILLN